MITWKHRSATVHEILIVNVQDWKTGTRCDTQLFEQDQSHALKCYLYNVLINICDYLNRIMCLSTKAYYRSLTYIDIYWSSLCDGDSSRRLSVTWTNQCNCTCRRLNGNPVWKKYFQLQAPSNCLVWNTYYKSVV